MCTFALQSLPEESVEHGAAVVAEGGPLVVVHREAVGDVDVEAAAAPTTTRNLQPQTTHPSLRAHFQG